MKKKEVKPVFIIGDNPEENEKRVGFGFDAYIKTLADLIAHSENETPLVIGIFGNWGSGKTTLMKNIRAFLDEDERYEKKPEVYRKCKTVWFQPWKYDKEEEILAALIEEIFKTMESDDFFEKCKARIEQLSHGLKKGKLLDGLIQVITGGKVTLNDFFADMEYKEKLGFYDTFQKFFDDLIRTYLSWRPQKDCFETYDDKKGALVVFIDDLDRCPQGRILKVLETIKLFMDKKGCVFVIGAALDIIVKELRKVYQEDAEKFMNKIVQVTFKLPQVRMEDFESYLAKIGSKMDAKTKKALSGYLPLILPTVQDNPRRLKRFINDLNLQTVLLENKGIDIEFNHLLFWNIIDFNYPALRKNIVENKNIEFFFTLKENIEKVKEKMSAAETGMEEVSDELLKNEKIPGSLHVFIKDKELVKVLEQFDCDRDQLLQLITLSGMVESAEAAKEKEQAGIKKKTGIIDIEMVKVPKGEFIYGEEGEKKNIGADYEIGIYPVTNAQYEAFIKDGGYQKDEYWSEEGMKWKNDERVELPGYSDDERFKHPEQPVVGVSYYEAEAYAAWLSEKTGRKYRLPKELEWEKAARGTDGRVYPWGNDFDKEKCNSEESGIGKTTRVTVYPNGVSPYGCYDMAGNVWEWCSNWYDESGSNRVMRGGSWVYDARLCRASYRRWLLPGYRGSNLGFRLARSLD